MVTREQYMESGSHSDLPYEVGVYTQGKVGSKAVLASLNSAFSSLEEAGENMYVWDYRRSDLAGVKEHQAVQGNRRRLLADDPEIADFLSAHLQRDLRMVSVVREPVAISLSSFFYNFVPRNPGVNIHELTDEEIIERLKAGESFSSRSFHLDWFDIEVEPMTGIDVYESGPFPYSQGFDHYSGMTTRSTDLLVLRLEDASRVARQALTDFYGIDVPELDQVNTAEQAETGYVDRYRSFKNNASLPEEWVMWQLDSKYAGFFYTPEEREAFANRWIR